MHSINRYKLTRFREVLLRWFGEKGRSFPWRDGGASLYQVIISEVLLQRTQAGTVARYFEVFFGKYPDWQALSKANLDDLEEIMKPLGLHKQRAARLYRLASGVRDWTSTVPSTRNQIEDSGFSGLYLINAYELFVLRKRKPLLDVNMSRVLKRYFCPGQFVDVRLDKEIQELAGRVVKVRECKELNWAILDFAALVCKARAPLCTGCPLNKSCAYYTKPKN